MKADNLKFLESRMCKISRTEGVPADSCRSCMHEIKVLAQNTKIHEQIYLLMAGKGLKRKRMLNFVIIHKVAYVVKISIWTVSHIT